MLHFSRVYSCILTNQKKTLNRNSKFHALCDLCTLFLEYTETIFNMYLNVDYAWGASNLKG